MNRFLLGVTLLAATTARAQSINSLPDSTSRRIDQIFSAYGPATPGCAVGVSRDGAAVFTRGYGSAHLEYGVPITDQTVFESGSVAKQFTAAAVVLLALDGKLSLDDDVRRYIPEVPSFGGRRITLRQMLNHTSGLRDQWGLLGIEGRGPGSQVHSPATTVDLISRQRALNFDPGSEYLYSNSGYTLLGVVVERVSGKSLDAFMQERLFQPLGMTRTQWRDDFTEIVPNRAAAYGGRAGGPYRTNVSFTNITGNGGLLFTVGDVLRWNENLQNPRVGGVAMRDSMQVRGKLTRGQTITYALGLQVQSYNGVPEIAHSGSTAGYQTFVARYPDHRLSVAVLCNGGNTTNPTGHAHQVADLFLPSRPRAAPQQASEPEVTLPAAQLAAWRGIYRDPSTDQLTTISARDGRLSAGAQPLVAVAPTRARAAAVGYLLDPSTRPRSVVVVRGGDSTRLALVAPADTSGRARAAYVGTYASDELDVKLVVAERDGRLVMLRRPDDVMPMRAVYRDGFTNELGSIRFLRDAAGRVTGFGIYAGRVRDVRFRKQP